MDSLISFNDRTVTYAQTRELLKQGQLCPIEAAESLFVYGYRLDQQGLRDGANAIYQDTIKVLEEVHASSVAEFDCFDYSKCAFNHGLSLYGLGRLTPARAAFTHATDKLDEALAFGVDSTVMEHFAMVLRWLGLTHYELGDPTQGKLHFERSVGIYRNLTMVAYNAAKKQELEELLQSTIDEHVKTLRRNSVKSLITH